MRKLADIVLEEKFRRRWGVREVAAPPPASPAFAATRASSFVLCHRLEGKETLAAVAVRHGCDVVALKRINNLLSDHAMYSRWGCGGLAQAAAPRSPSCPVRPLRPARNSLPCRHPVQEPPVCAGARCGGCGRGTARGFSA